MKLKNFRNVKELPSGALTAEVDVEQTKFFLFNTEKTCVVFCTHSNGRWRWLNTGSIIEGTSIDNLYTAYKIIKEL